MMNLFIYLLGFYAAFNIISVISRQQFTYSWSLGKQTSTRLENVPCPKTLHHDRSAATGDQTRDTRFRNTRRLPLDHSGFLKNDEMRCKVFLKVKLSAK